MNFIVHASSGSGPKTINGRYGKGSTPLKYLLIMKLTLFLIVTFNLCASANALAQKVSLTVKNESFRSVILTLQQQTDYSFFIKAELLKQARPVTADLSDIDLLEALPVIFEDQPFDYEIEGKVINVYGKTGERAKVNRTKEAQPRAIQGRVTDSVGNPLEGATIVVKENGESVKTDANGSFEISTNYQNCRFQISYVGFEQKEVPFEALKHVILTRKVSRLDDVVVIAYGKTTQRLNTGAVGRITSKEIENQPVSNPLATLQGRIPGLVIEQNNGMPGSNFMVQIRGRNSIGQGTSPLFLIDGIPFDIDYTSNTNYALNVNNPFNMINPAEIERIDVLKDAEATAIYGSRGANGVILITTKSGQKGKLKVSASQSLGFSKLPKYPNMLSPEKFRELRREAFVNDNVLPTERNAFDLFGLDTTIVNDWAANLIGGTAKTANSNLTVEGGSDKTVFRLNGAIYNEDNVFPGDDGIGRASLSTVFQSSDSENHFQINAGLYYAYGKTKQAVVDLTENVNKVPYGFTLIDEDGNLVWDDVTKTYGNPLSYLYQNFESKNHRFFPTLKMSYSILPNLSIAVNSGLTYDMILPICWTTIALI